ncbi:hypothetical protein AB9Q10_27740 [Streptomyces krungchingensis]|uniref:hypothetical protein n=1 Tax=Streptomyces TaxID=1883 RepID=UPI003CE8963D
MAPVISGSDDIRALAAGALARCGVEVSTVKGDGLVARTPVTGAELFGLRGNSPADVDRAVEV